MDNENDRINGGSQQDNGAYPIHLSEKAKQMPCSDGDFEGNLFEFMAMGLVSS